MAGAIYFPTLQMAPVSWLASEVVRWDAVAVVLPYLAGPRTDGFEEIFAPLEAERLAIRFGVSTVHQLFGDAFGRHIDLLDPAESARRRLALRAGAAVELFDEPYMWWALSQILYDRGVVTLESEASVIVEETTARELAATLALGVSHPLCDFPFYAHEQIGVEDWLPVTDDWAAFMTLCTAVSTTSVDGRSRFGTRLASSIVRCVVLPGRPPLPTVPADIAAALDLRRERGAEIRDGHLRWFNSAVGNALRDAAAPRTGSRSAALVAVDSGSGAVETMAYYCGTDAVLDDVAAVGSATLAQLIDEGLGVYEGHGEYWSAHDDDEFEEMRAAIEDKYDDEDGTADKDADK